MPVFYRVISNPTVRVISHNPGWVADSPTILPIGAPVFCLTNIHIGDYQFRMSRIMETINNSLYIIIPILIVRKYRFHDHQVIA